MITLPAELSELETVEDYLGHFGIPYDPTRAKVLRLHILQRFRDYLDTGEVDHTDEAAIRAAIGDALQRAYDDFVRSDPLTERVFKILKDADPATHPPRSKTAFIPLDAVLGTEPTRD